MTAYLSQERALVADPEGRHVALAPFPDRRLTTVKYSLVMLETRCGRDDDALTSTVYEAGREYAVGAELFRAFVVELRCAQSARAGEDVAANGPTTKRRRGGSAA